MALLWSPASESPNRYFNWLTTISTAEPEMKPLTTGRLSNCDRKPRRSKPPASNIKPDSNASAAASTMYWGEWGAASGLSTA